MQITHWLKHANLNTLTLTLNKHSYSAWTHVQPDCVGVSLSFPVQRFSVQSPLYECVPATPPNTEEMWATYLPPWWSPSRLSRLTPRRGTGGRGWAGRWARCSGWGRRASAAPSGRGRWRRSWGRSSGGGWSSSGASSPSTRCHGPGCGDPAWPPRGPPWRTWGPDHNMVFIM